MSRVTVTWELCRTSIRGTRLCHGQNVRQKFEKAWNVVCRTVGDHDSRNDGLVIDGSAKGMYIFGENPVLADPDKHHVSVLSISGILVVQDISD